MSFIKIVHIFVPEIQIMFSKACEYAIRATIYIASQSNQGNRVGLKEIAKEIDSPEAFTAKIMQQLTRNSIVNSVKGPNGGFEIEEKRLSKVKLAAVVQAIDGDGIFKVCGLGLKECSEKVPCPVHHRFKAIREGLVKMLNDTSVLELACNLEQGAAFLK